jgi:hypothetical protein
MGNTNTKKRPQGQLEAHRNHTQHDACIAIAGGIIQRAGKDLKSRDPVVRKSAQKFFVSAHYRTLCELIGTDPDALKARIDREGISIRQHYPHQLVK